MKNILYKKNHYLTKRRLPSIYYYRLKLYRISRYIKLYTYMNYIMS